MVSGQTPKRGVLWLVDFSPVSGREQGGRRPALVLSRTAHNERSAVVSVAPFTSSLTMKEHPAAMFMPAAVSGLRQESLLLLFQARAVDKARLDHCLSKLSDEMMAQVTEILFKHLGA